MAEPRKDEESAVHIEPEKRPSPSQSSSDDGSKNSHEIAEHEDGTPRRTSVAALLRNPLTGMSEGDVIRDRIVGVSAQILQLSSATYEGLCRAATSQ